MVGGGIFCQIAVAIGVLTSNRGEGDEPLWWIGRGTRVPLQGAEHVVPLPCHRRVPLQCVMVRGEGVAGCHCSVLWFGGAVKGGDDQLWRR